MDKNENHNQNDSPTTKSEEIHTKPSFHHEERIRSPPEPVRFLQNMMNKSHAGEDSVRLINSIYFSMVGIVSLLIPGMILGFYGHGWDSSSSTATQQRYYGLLCLTLAGISSLSSVWPTATRIDLLRILGLTHLSFAIWNFLSFLFGSTSWMIWLNIGIHSLLCFAHAKQVGLI